MELTLNGEPVAVEVEERNIRSFGDLFSALAEDGRIPAGHAVLSVTVDGERVPPWGLPVEDIAFEKISTLAIETDEVVRVVSATAVGLYRDLGFITELLGEIASGLEEKDFARIGEEMFHVALMMQSVIGCMYYLASGTATMDASFEEMMERVPDLVERINMSMASEDKDSLRRVLGEELVDLLKHFRERVETIMEMLGVDIDAGEEGADEEG